MVSITVDKNDPIVTLEPEGAVSVSDMEMAVHVIDAFIKTRGGLLGMMVYADATFDAKGFVAHIGALKLHKQAHKRLKRLAFVTDASVDTDDAALRSFFSQADIRRFAYDEKAQAKAWLLENISST